MTDRSSALEGLRDEEERPRSSAFEGLRGRAEPPYSPALGGLRNQRQGQVDRNLFIKDAVQRERDRKKGRIFLPGPYEISQAPGIPTWESARRQMIANMGPIPDYVPVGAPRDEYQLPQEWSDNYKNQVLGPENEPLPPGATGWTRYGQPYYGDGDQSLVGDFKAWWNSIWGNMNDPTVQQPAYTAFNQAWQDRVAAMAEEEPVGLGIHPASLKIIGSVFGEIRTALVELGNKARNVQPGNSIGEQMALALSYAGRTAGNIIKMAGDAVNLPTEAFKKTYGAVLLKNKILASKSTLPDLPVYDDWRDYFTRMPVLGGANPLAVVYDTIRAVESGKRWTDAEREELAVGPGLDPRLFQASRIAYSMMLHDGLAQDYIMRMNEGADPRLLALELEDPVAEMWGEILNDPLIIFGLMSKGKKTANAMKLGESKWAAQSDELIEAFGHAPRTTAQGVADNIDEIVRLNQEMMQAARVAETELATSRSIRALTATAKRSVYGRQDADILGIIAAHYTGQGDELLDTMKWMAMSASDNADEVARALSGLSHSDLPREFLFSPSVNRTKIVLRELLYDASGKLKTSLIDDIAKAGDDPEKLIELMSGRMDSIYNKHFPNVQEQVEQGVEYQRLLAEDADEAARYLDTHPAASQSVSPALQRAAKFHSVMEKGPFKIAHGAQGFLYMVLSPAYWLRNRMSNAFHVFVDQGIKPGLRTLIYGPGDAIDQIKKWTGGMVPTGAQFGFGPAGGEMPKFAKKGFLAKAAANEQDAAKIIQAHSLRQTMTTALEEGKALPELVGSVRGITDGEAQYLVGLVQDNGGDIRTAINQFFSTKGQVSRNFGWMDSNTKKILMDYKVHDEALQTYMTSLDRDELYTKLDELSDGMDDLGDLVAGETATLDMTDMTQAERSAHLESIDSIRINEGDEAADGFTRRVNTNRYARNQTVKAQQESERFAIRMQQSQIEAMIKADPEYMAQLGIREAKEIPLRAADEGKRYIDQIRAEAGIDDLSGRWQEVFADADDYREATWAINDATKGKGPWKDIPTDELWRRAGFEGKPPKGMTGREFRDKLWPGYRETQELRYAQERELEYIVRRGYTEVLNQMYGIEGDLQSWTRAEVAMDEARRLQNAYFDDGMFYVDEVVGGEALRAEYTQLNRRLWEEGVPDAELETIRQRMREIDDELLPVTQAPEAGRVTEPFEMTREEYFSALQRSRTEFKDIEIELFGEEAAKRYRSAQTTVNSPMAGIDEAKYERASKLIDEMEAGLTETQRNRLFGVGDEARGYEELKEFRGAFDVLEDAPDELLIDEVRRNITAIAPEELRGFLAGTETLDDAKQIAYMKVRNASEILTSRGFNSEEILQQAARQLAEQLGPEDAKFLLDDWINKKPGAARQIERIPVAAADDGVHPTIARVAHESRGGFRQFVDETLKPQMAEHFDEIAVSRDSILKRADLEEWATEATQRVTQTRAVAVEVANAARDFALHDYGKRMGIDLLLSYIYPYQFWYSRTYVKWMKRLTQNPALIAAYFRYKRTLEKVHAGAPEWYKYQLNTNELFGQDSDNPLYFNLEATLNPIYGLIGTDFKDKYKRVDGTSTLLDELGKFGPTIWTPYALALATYYHIDGQDEAAARWGGRMTTLTRSVRDATSLLGVKGGAGLEIDPFIHLYSGGMGPYDRNRVGRTLGEMLEEGYDQAALEDAANRQEGELWNIAVGRATKARAAGNLFASVAGAGFKPRSPTDLQIDRMWGDMYSLTRMKGTLSPEEYSQQWEKLREAYPFLDMVSLARKGGIERDEAFAWSVLRRIPPAMTRNLAEAVGINPDLPNLFYENKGDLLSMSESDRMHFMAGIADMAAILEIPSAATSKEWKRASKAYSRMYDDARGKWGDDIWDRVDNYYGAKGDSQEDQDRANAILDKDPAISEVLNWKSLYVAYNPLLATYYNGIDKLESYYKGRMWDQIEQELGSDIWEKWDILYALPEDSDARDDYWDENEDEFRRYGDIKDEWLPIIQERIDEFSKYIRDAIPAQPRDVTPESLGQEQLLEALRQQQAEQVQQFSPEQLQQILGEPLFRLVVSGQDLPSVANIRLAEIASGLGVTIEELLAQLTQ